MALTSVLYLHVYGMPFIDYSLYGGLQCNICKLNRNIIKHTVTHLRTGKTQSSILKSVSSCEVPNDRTWKKLYHTACSEKVYPPYAFFCAGLVHLNGQISIHNLPIGKYKASLPYESVGGLLNEMTWCKSSHNQGARMYE